MKHRSLLVVIFLVTALSSLAQIPKGVVLLGASVGLNTNNFSERSNSSIDLNPRVGIAVGNNWVLGARLGVSFSTYKSEEYNYQKDTYNDISGTIFVRKYVPLKNRLGLYTELGAGIGFSRISYKTISIVASSEGRQRASSYNTGITPGIYYRLSPRLLISADVGGLNYTYSKSKYESPDFYPVFSYTSDFRLSFLNSFNFGIDLIL